MVSLSFREGKLPLCELSVRISLAGRKIEITFNLWHTAKHFLLTIKAGGTI